MNVVNATGRTILSLFDATGIWSQPYADAGANVVMVDLVHGMNVMDITATWLTEEVFPMTGTVDGILAAPPCTDFARSGAQYWPAKDADGRTAHSLELVRQVLRCVEFCKPTFWAIENPVGRLNRLMPELSRFGPWYFQPCDYGDPYNKRTGLWGCFIRPMPLWTGRDLSVAPVRSCNQGSWLMRLPGRGKHTQRLRSATPPGFAAAFAAANCWPHPSP
jgi:hypothetical protein